MNEFHRFLIIVSAAGLFTGLAVRRSASPDISRRETGRPPAETADVVGQAPAVRAFPPPHSTDTLESLAPLEDGNLYARLALWLTDASAADIAAFWSPYSKKEDISEDIAKLVFLNWTRLDPQAALAAAGEDYAFEFWIGWSCNDPQAALAASIATKDADVVETVACGIARNDPDWLRGHFQEIPEAVRASALQSLSGGNSGNPLKAIHFLLENHREVDGGTLKALVRVDPWAAFDWAKEHKDKDDSFRGGDPVESVIEAMATEHPQDLERLIAQTPSGETKLKMESAIFDNLVKTDPAAALEKAKATTIPRSAAERYAAIGRSLVLTDPEQALDMARSLFAACPDALDLNAAIEFPDGKDDVDISIPNVDEFMEALMGREPEKLLDLYVANTGRHEDTGQFEDLAESWAEQDLGAYTTWVNRQPDPAVRSAGALLVMRELEQADHYEEALDWAMSLDDSDSDHVDELLSSWKGSDKAAASDWLEASDLPAEHKARIRARFEQD